MSHPSLTAALTALETRIDSYLTAFLPTLPDVGSDPPVAPIDLFLAEGRDRARVFVQDPGVEQGYVLRDAVIRGQAAWSAKMANASAIAAANAAATARYEAKLAEYPATAETIFDGTDLAARALENELESRRIDLAGVTLEPLVWVSPWDPTTLLVFNGGDVPGSMLAVQARASVAIKAGKRSGNREIVDVVRVCEAWRKHATLVGSPPAAPILRAVNPVSDVGPRELAARTTDYLQGEAFT